MIILDTSILRSISPESSSADLLHAIKAICGQPITMPWVVMEELAAQQAIKYQELHERAVQAVEALQHGTPWKMAVEVGGCDTERVRDHWRHRWDSLIGVIPTSDEALRQAIYREANRLPPCKESKGQKTGSRDAAIWLSAVEYAEEHPDETVFFVSANTKDFGDGTSYPYPMNKDIADAGVSDRFILMTSLDEVASHFTEPAEVDEGLVAEILGSAAVLQDMAETAEVVFPAPFDPTFQCAIPVSDGNTVIEQARNWQTVEADLGSADDIRAYRIGKQEWCTASVEWHFTGFVQSEWFGLTWGAVTWKTAVLFNLDPQNPSLTVLREAPPQPSGDDALRALGIPCPDATTVERALASLRQAANTAADATRPWPSGGLSGLPRTTKVPWSGRHGASA
ncbi:PIN domain-containing protein [Streptomyces sp. CRB46]|uniref:PIN domain-containing protein n=1 Tax=Streptomyces sp. CRB46 TaxID=2682613 RepID=UPI0018F28F96|nr:PIN domain-containing protein [Streptomyces sp. CRB46]